ncbi:MAG: hypothetical protein AUI47_00770 [Acidobacteria bacterium 13_1_40CM_2_68_5]|nr:MAG: hypothetical protein AUI47_00770 [Acidobacteria bacterium 13_1_40CM_2_68_5]
MGRAFAYGARFRWSGWDPYDGLRSPLSRLPLLGSRPTIRLGLTQLIKRSPWNLRSVLLVSQHVNAKTIALCLSATSRAPADAGLDASIAWLVRSLEDSRARDWPLACWGYDFPWQSRSFYLPAGTPTVVVTAFAGEASLDAHAATGDERCVSMALDACRFIREALNRTEDETGVCLSYSPLDRTAVYNASLLGARLLALTGQRARRPELIEQARPLVTYVLARQREDGSWSYGDGHHQGWTDSFHTGFVLGALDVYRRATGDKAVAGAVERGARFYALRFFGPSGEPYYYPNRRYPYDIHSAAQGVLTFLQLRDLFPDFTERALSVGRWMVRTMLDPEGFFYYQVRRTHTVKIPYMRWSQAWGVRALAELAHCGVEL